MDSIHASAYCSMKLVPLEISVTGLSYGYEEVLHHMVPGSKLLRVSVGACVYTASILVLYAGLLLECLTHIPQSG